MNLSVQEPGVPPTCPLGFGLGCTAQTKPSSHVMALLGLPPRVGPVCAVMHRVPWAGLPLKAFAPRADGSCLLGLGLSVSLAQK